MARVVQSRRVTIVDIARHLNVNVSTVSRALTGKLVSPETVQRVRAAAAELGYRPNIGASIMKSGRTGMFGILVPTINDPYFARFVELCQSMADEINYSIVLGIYERSTKNLLRLLDHLVGDRRVDGIIFFPAHDPQVANCLANMSDNPVPIVQIGPSVMEHIHWVCLDYVRGARMLTKHLLELGHRRIHFLFGVLGDVEAEQVIRFDKRLEGMALALHEYGLQLEPEMVWPCRSDLEPAYKTVQRRMRELAEPPTAIIAINDTLAYATMQALTDLGLQVPQDVSVAGFNNIEQAQFLKLTTIDGRTEELVQHSIEVLRSVVLEKKQLSPAFSKVVQPELIIRGSTGPVSN